MEEMKNNAQLFANYFIERGWSKNAICGMLGNIQVESNINPGLWESLEEGNLQGGYGLVQWTPATKYIDWAVDNYSDGNKQCERIQYEVDNNLQWISTDLYNITFKEFTTSDKTPHELAMIFLANYERPLNPNQPLRGEYAEYWYNTLNFNGDGGVIQGKCKLIKNSIYPYDFFLGSKVNLTNKEFRLISTENNRAIIEDNNKFRYTVFKKYLKML